MNQPAHVADRNAEMLDEAVRRVVTSMPEKALNIVDLRSELAKALDSGATTLFHLLKIGRDFAARPAQPTLHQPDLVDRQWLRDKITGALFEMGWHLDGKSAFIRATDKAHQPIKPSPQQIADMCRGAERMRQSA